MKTDAKLTVVLPAFNEEATIGDVIRVLYSCCSEIIEEVIVVDDGSTDKTAEIAASQGAKVIIHVENRGYGTALKTGIRATKTEWVATMDCDGQHRAEDLLVLWQQIDGNDMVVGQRKGLSHSNLWRMPGKWVLSLISNYLAKRTIPDLNSGMRIADRETILKYIHLCPSGFSFSTTITLAMLSRGHKVAYVPITVTKRKEGASLVSVSTGVDTFMLILRISSLFGPLRIFIPLSLASGLLGVVLAVLYFIAASTISGAPILLMVTSVLLFALGLICDQVSQLRLERYE
jgi:glycosyltransferase involved in cell wall biosynthesis